jgi:hypothetical protein
LRSGRGRSVVHEEDPWSRIHRRRLTAVRYWKTLKPPARSRRIDDIGGCSGGGMAKDKDILYCFFSLFSFIFPLFSSLRPPLGLFLFLFASSTISIPLSDRGPAASPFPALKPPPTLANQPVDSTVGGRGGPRTLRQPQSIEWVNPVRVSLFGR